MACGRGHLPQRMQYLIVATALRNLWMTSSCRQIEIMVTRISYWLAGVGTAHEMRERPLVALAGHNLLCNG